MVKVSGFTIVRRSTGCSEISASASGLDTGPALRLLPHKHGCDGFYAEVLTRVA